MSLATAQNSKQERWQVKGNELLINQADLGCNSSPGDKQNSWKSPLLGQRWGGWGCRSRSVAWWTHPWVPPRFFLHLLLLSAPRYGWSYSQEERKWGGWRAWGGLVMKRANTLARGWQGRVMLEKYAWEDALCLHVSACWPVLMTHFCSVCTRPQNVIFILR